MALDKLEKNISIKQKTKKRTVVYSTKIFIAVSMASLVGFIIVVVFGILVFRDFAVQATESESDFSFIKRVVVANDKFISINSNLPTIFESDPVKGNDNAEVTIIEFGDYESSYCASMQNTLARILLEYPNQVKIVWKDLPNSSNINNAIAARCAQSQEKFWEMNELLLQNSYILNRGRLSDFAKDLNLNLDEFNNCMDSSNVTLLIQENIDQATNLQIGGAPYYFVNNQEINGSISYDDLKKFVELELEK